MKIVVVKLKGRNWTASGAVRKWTTNNKCYLCIGETPGKNAGASKNIIVLLRALLVAAFFSFYLGSYFAK